MVHMRMPSPPKLLSPVKMAELQEDDNGNDSLSKSALAGILAVSGIFFKQ